MASVPPLRPERGIMILTPHKLPAALLFKTHPHPDYRLSKPGVAIGEHFDGMNGKPLGKRLYRIK